MKTSFPKNRIRILLLENIHPVAVSELQKEGFDVETRSVALSENELSELVPDFHAVGLRSKTQLTEKVLKRAEKLLVVGAFCIGTDQIDTRFANHRGVPVFNAPHSNTRSVAELVIAEMIALSRQLGDRSMHAHQGKWNKSANGSREVRGKTLGIVGYGHIGSQVSILAEALGLQVLFYDVVKKLPLGNSKRCDRLADVLKNSDFVSLHVPDTAETRNMITANELSLMKKGSHLINASRGMVVNIEDLASALKSKHLAGCAIDVFPQEPASNDERFVSPIQNLTNVILTPHIGGSTEEAQENIGREVSESFIRFINNGSTTGAVNFPQVDLPVQREARRILNVHRNVPGVLRDINKIVSDFGSNISAQYLSTDSEIGYLVMDMAIGNADQVCEEIKKLSTSIRTRILY